MRLGLRALAFSVAVFTAMDGAQAASSMETVALRDWITRGSSRLLIGGQWNGGFNSVGWLEQKAITGRDPSVYGIEYFDNGPLENRPDAREMGRSYAIEKFRRGGIVTLVDHMPNFVSGGDAWNRDGEPLSAILPGGSRHEQYRQYLDRTAAFLSSLSVNGVLVPVLYRPFHEMNGGWFWWGDSLSGDRFVQLWRFTYDYLQNQKGVRNALWVWSPNIENSASVTRFMKYWPGSQFVDVVGFDGYDNSTQPDFVSSAFRGSYQALVQIASSSKLPFAMTEIGFEYGAQEITGFWTTQILTALNAEYPAARYVHLWNSKWGPRAGSAAAPSFASMIYSGEFLLDGDISGVSVYGSGFAVVR